MVSLDASMKELSDKLDPLGLSTSTEVEDDFVYEDHEEVENVAPSDEDWEWPAEQTEKVSLSPKILQEKDISDDKSEVWGYFHVKRDGEGRKFAMCTKCPDDKSSAFALESDSDANDELEASKIEAPGSIPSAELLNAMLDRLEALLPKDDLLKYDSRVKRVDWTEVAFEGMDAGQCKKWWHHIQERVRRYRIMKELLPEARTWISQPWTNFYKSKEHNRKPGMPKKPPTAYLLFFTEMRKEMLRANPEMRPREVTKACSEEYAKLSPGKMREYKVRCADLRKEYVANLAQFYRDNPHLRPNRSEKDQMGPTTAVVASEPSEPTKSQVSSANQSAWNLWNHLKHVHSIEKPIQSNPQPQPEPEDSMDSNSKLSQVELTPIKDTTNSNSRVPILSISHPQLEPMEGSTDSNSRLCQVEHEPIKATTNSNSRVQPKKAKLPKIPKSTRTISGPCPICNKELKTKTHGAMQSHIRNSHNGGWYRCEVCTHIERFPIDLVEHVLSQHPGTDCVKCKGCNQMINFGGNPQSFEDHVR